LRHSKKPNKGVTNEEADSMNIERLLNQQAAKFTTLTAIIGASHDIYGRVAFYISAVNTIMIFGVFYATVIKPTPAFNWITLPLFVLIVLIAVLIVAIIVWKIIIPQLIAYGNYQGYRHGNPIRKDLEEIKQLLKDQDEILREQKSTGPPIVASLEAISKYYMDYISKQKGEDRE